MVVYDLQNGASFRVLHESGLWRTAMHRYDSKVNGIEALWEWGIHEDSEEAFVLLCGECVLAVQSDSAGAEIIPMEPLRQYVVGVAQMHAIALKEGATVLIMENADMSRFKTMPMDKEVQDGIRAALERTNPSNQR